MTKFNLRIIYFFGLIKSLFNDLIHWFKKHKESWLLTFAVDFGIEILIGIITAIQEAIDSGGLLWSLSKGTIYAIVVSTTRQVARDQLEKSKEKLKR